MSVKLFIVSFLLFLSACQIENPKINKEKSQILKDDLGIPFVTDSIPSKVISLAPNLTEIIYLLSEEDKITGVTSYCNFPEEALNKQKVGDMLNINFEKITSLQPDLIFITVEGNDRSAYLKLIKLGHKVFVSNPRDLDGIQKTIRDLASIFHKKLVADQIIVSWNHYLDTLRQNADNRTGISGIFLVSTFPVMAAGGKTFINEIFRLSGVANLAKRSELNYPVFSRESILELNPDFIIIPGDGKNEVSELINAYPEWQILNAVKNHAVFFVEPDLYLRPGPRFIDALKDFNRRLDLLHPQNQ